MRSSATGSALALVVRAEPGGHRGDEQHVAAPAVAPCGLARTRHRQRLEVGGHRARQGDRRQRPTGDDELAGHGVDDPDAALHVAHHGVDRVAVARSPAEMPAATGRAIDVRSTVTVTVPGRRPAGRAVGCGFGGRRLRGPGGIGGRFGGRAIEQQLDQRHAADAVGQHVVGAQVQRGAAALEPLDHGDVPRRADRLERRRLHERDDVEHLAMRAGRRQRQHAQVVARVEVGLGDPVRTGPRTRRIVQPPRQPRCLVGQRVQPGDQLVDVRQALEDDEVADRHAQRRILPGAPHDGLEWRQRETHRRTLACSWPRRHRLVRMNPAAATFHPPRVMTPHGLLVGWAHQAAPLGAEDGRSAVPTFMPCCSPCCSR